MHFSGVEYDGAGKFLVLHHHSAAYYYKINVAVLLFFFGVTLYSYVNAPHVFFGQEWLANVYLFALQGGILGVYLFSNKHIKSLRLLRGG